MLNVTFSVPVFGDHVLVLVELNVKRGVNNDTFQKRDWTSYSPIDMNNTLLSNLNIASTDWSSLDVQASWNAFENIIINTVDKLAPIKIFPVDQPLKVKNLPFSIKNKINKRNRLLKKRDDTSHLPQLKSLSKEIKEFFRSKKISKVKKASLGPKTNIWRAVKAAKDLSSVGLPTNLTLGGVPVLRGTFANTFATHFHSKVVTNTRKVKVKSTVYNGKCQLIVANRNFMTPDDVKCCLYDLSNKKCEGFDRIPVCSLYDARAVLFKPLSILFDKIYKTCSIPEQWKISKIIPIYKKGNKSEIENYRPIANLCSASKIFEKLILKQIHCLESTNKLGLTGKNQHGFKCNKSTATAGALLQSIIAHAADEKCFYFFLVLYVFLTPPPLPGVP